MATPVTVCLEELPAPGGVGVFAVRTGKGRGRRGRERWTQYGFREIKCEVGGRGFVVGGGRDVYHARVGPEDGDTDCECLGFAGHGYCKHVAGLTVAVVRMAPVAFDFWGRVCDGRSAGGLAAAAGGDAAAAGGR